MSLLLKLKERFSDKQIETNDVINEYVEKVDDEIKNSKIENKENDANKDNEKASVDINIQALANALEFKCNFRYSNEITKFEEIRLDKNIVIEARDFRTIIYDDLNIERMLPAIKLAIKIDDIWVRNLILKRNIDYKWEISHQNDSFPLSDGVVNYINGWSEHQSDIKKKAEEFAKILKNKKKQEKLDKLIEIYEEYKEYEE